MSGTLKEVDGMQIIYVVLRRACSKATAYMWVQPGSTAALVEEDGTPAISASRRGSRGGRRASGGALVCPRREVETLVFLQLLDGPNVGRFYAGRVGHSDS